MKKQSEPAIFPLAATPPGVHLKKKPSRAVKVCGCTSVARPEIAVTVPVETNDVHTGCLLLAVDARGGGARAATGVTATVAPIAMAIDRPPSHVKRLIAARRETLPPICLL